MNEENLDNVHEEDRDDYDYDFDSPSTKNASIVGKLSGDAFGNYADYLWKCKECSGLFVAARYSSLTFFVGMISYVEPRHVIEERIQSLWNLYYKAAHEENLCRCESRGKPFTWAGSPFAGLAARGLSLEDLEEDDLEVDNDQNPDPS